MKKTSKMLALVLCLVLVLTFVAGCGVNGKYYLVIDGEKTEEYIQINGETWEDSNGLTGDVKVDGDEITLSKKVLGLSVDFMVLTKDGSELTSGILGLTYKK